MRRSEAFLGTSREAGDRENDTVALAIRAGLVRQFGGGIYGIAPTGERVRRKIIRTIEDEMDRIGGQQISLPNLQPRRVWERSGRWKNFANEMFTLDTRQGTDYCLAPTHEESIVHLVDGQVRSHADVPLLLYQVGRKHRDDHPRRGLLRTKEFTMKDAYSLHGDEASLDRSYDRIRSAYERIFDRIGVEYVIAESQNDLMGGTASEEFLAPVDTGSEAIVRCKGAGCRYAVTDETTDIEMRDRESCPECGDRLERSPAIELAHVFKLGTRYSEPMDLTVTMADGFERPVWMGSYGIGIERLMHVLIEQHSDADGCRWPDTDTCVAPYQRAIIPLEYDGRLRAIADAIYAALGSDETLLFDDTDRTIGERFAESDLLGVPRKLIIGNHYLETGDIEVENRDGDVIDRLTPARLADTTANDRSTRTMRAGRDSNPRPSD